MMVMVVLVVMMIVMMVLMVVLVIMVVVMTDGDKIACDCGEKTVILPVHNKLLQTSDQISNQPKKDK